MFQTGEQVEPPIQTDLAGLYETRHESNTQAYMLIYIREDQIATVLQEPDLQSIPEYLTQRLEAEEVYEAKMK